MRGSVLDMSFHRIKALAAISSPSSAEQQRADPRDMTGGGGERKEGARERERQADRKRREREYGEADEGGGGGGVLRGWGDES